MAPASVAASRSRTGFPFESALRILMRTSEAGVLVLDPRGRVRSVNDAAQHLLGLRPRQALGEPGSSFVRTVVPGDDPVREARAAARTERETVLLRPDGAGTPVLIRSRRIGRPPWVLLLLRDLTQQRRMQQELRRHERLATLGQLSAGVAHEIRNPLAGIGTSAQVLLRRFEPRDERARFVRVILDEVARLDRHRDQPAPVRAPAHARAGTRMSSASCLERVRELTAETVADAGIAVEVDAPRALPAVHVDRDLVTQVLLNVTAQCDPGDARGGNPALRGAPRAATPPEPRAGPAGFGRRARRARRGSRMDRIPADARDRHRSRDSARRCRSKLFDPFFSTKPARGTGLGLAISQTIMQEHGGTIEIASREGRGTTVLLNFPVEKRHGERRDSRSDRGRAHTPRR